MYLLTIGSALMLFPYVLRKSGMAAISSEWRANSGSIILASLLVFLGYGLVLTAFSLSRVSYIAPAREVGIVLGVLLGVFLLKEPFGTGRLLSSGLDRLGLGANRSLALRAGVSKPHAEASPHGSRRAYYIPHFPYG